MWLEQNLRHNNLAAGTGWGKRERWGAGRPDRRWGGDSRFRGYPVSELGRVLCPGRPPLTLEPWLYIESLAGILLRR